jgi:hypothetical protein
LKIKLINNVFITVSGEICAKKSLQEKPDWTFCICKFSMVKSTNEFPMKVDPVYSRLFDKSGHIV